MKCIFLAGNVSEGFRAYGPCKDFDEAAEKFDGVEGWVMDLIDPKEFKPHYNVDKALAEGLKAEINEKS